MTLALQISTKKSNLSCTVYLGKLLKALKLRVVFFTLSTDLGCTLSIAKQKNDARH